MSISKNQTIFVVVAKRDKHFGLKVFPGSLGFTQQQAWACVESQPGGKFWADTLRKDKYKAIEVQLSTIIRHPRMSKKELAGESA